MSGGSGGGSQQTQSTQLPAWAVPYAQNYMQKGQALGETPYQAYTGQRYVPQNGMQQAGIQQQANQAYGGSAVNNAASQNLTGTLNGDYLSSGNPYLTSQIDKAQGDVARNYNLTTRPQLDSLDARSGSFGNSGVAQTGQEQQRQLGEQMSNISTQMRGADYANERNRQLSAAGMAPGASQASYNDSQQLFNAGTAANQPAQQQADFNYSQFQDQQNDPYKKLTAVGAPFGAQLGSTTTGQGSSSNSAGQWLGGALTGASALGSMGSGK